MIVSLQKPADTLCRHCGADLLGGGLEGTHGARFCCEGCRVVHGMLSGEDGGVYYDLMRQSGARAPRAAIAPAYRRFLDELRDPEALRRIGRWEGGVHGLTLECSDMQCAACGWLMERVLGETDGVVDYEVDFVHGEMHVRYDAARLRLPELLERVGRFGYPFRPKAGAAARPALDRAAWMRLAVAAACFLNAMAFSFGPYLGVTRGMDAEWMRVLGLWSFAATLPAVFYAAFPFYQGAWRALRGRSFTIDVTVTLGIALAFAASLASAISTFSGGDAVSRLGHFNYSDTLTGLVFFLLLGRYAVRRFEGGLSLRGRWHEALSPGAVRVVAADGTVRWVPLGEVAVDDLVEIPPGEYLPVDGNALEAGEADTAFLTGEDRPRAFAAGDFLFAGYRVLGSALRLRVANPHARTRAAALGRALESLAARKRVRNVRRERVALGFTLVVTAAAVAALFLHAASGWEKALLTAASVFIVSCSCALALAVPVSWGVGLLRLHRQGFHFRSQETPERLAAVRSVIFDKTGTLTFTRRTLDAWEWAPEFPRDAAAREDALRAAARLAGMSTHPVAAAVHAGLGREGGTVAGFAELPHFGLRGTWSEGSRTLDLVLCRHGAWEGEGADFRACALEAPPDEAATAENPPQSCLFVNGRLAARIRLGEEVRPGVPALLRKLEAAGLATLLLSGDHPERVAAFARRCGFGAYRGGLSPEAKQAEARAFQERHGPALAVGDGYNDSLLFGEASVSLAVQGAAGPVAAEADAFMTNPDPASLPDMLRIARGMRSALRNCYIVSGVYNAATISLAVAGMVSPLTAAILMPAASLSLFLTAWVTVPRR